MAVINILSPHVADMIAAGEVVERPASVIKELVENALDAGAKCITVEIRGGGATYIRVTDDGCGMSPEDAGVAFLRHATSKLRDEKGLECIGTMGFRGEALAAISAVSHIELTTRLRGNDEGVYMTLDAGDIVEMRAAGCPEGSTITVKDIFFNTPARLKFLKSDRSEASACSLAALRCALGHPEVSLRFLRDGQEEFFSPGDGRADSCIYSLLGRDLAASLLECSNEENGIKVTGFVSAPRAGRGNRAQQYFYGNGRFIKSALLQAAVEQAYKNTLLTGRYPACVIYLGIGLGSVDVNVHPAKTEVKFSYEKTVFDIVYRAVRLALENEGRTAEVVLSPSTVKAAAPKADFYKSMSTEQFRQNGFAVKAPPAAPIAAAPMPFTAEVMPDAPVMAKSYEIPYQTSFELNTPHISPLNPPKAENTTQHIEQLTAKGVEKAVQNVERWTIPEHKIVGEAMKTYIIVECGEELILIDKHAAHERIIFDRLKAQQGQIMAQTLLMPVVVSLSGEDAELLEKNEAALSALGFEIEPYGQREYALRALPADMTSADASAAIEEICEKLKQSKGLDPACARDEILHTVACKAAIKAGWDTQGEELAKLVDAVLSGQVKYCPHGRPVSVTMTRKELDKQFKRIV